MKHIVSIVVGAAALMVSLSGALAERAPRVVAIVVATPAPNIKRSAEKNQENIKSFLEYGIGGTGGIEVVPFYVTGADFSCAAITSIVSGRLFHGRSVQIRPTDTVIFYYAGHGYHDAAQPAFDKFPKLMCSQATLPDPGKDLTLRGVADAIAKSHPRFILAIADSCNAPTTFGGPRGGLLGLSPKALAELFVQYKGVLLFSAAKPGQFAYYRDDGEGSLFTNQLLASISAEIVRAANTDDRARWEKIEETATAPFVRSDRLPIDTEQDPQSNSDDPGRALVYCGACTTPRH